MVGAQSERDTRDRAHEQECSVGVPRSDATAWRALVQDETGTLAERRQRADRRTRCLDIGDARARRHKAEIRSVHRCRGRRRVNVRRIDDGEVEPLRTIAAYTRARPSRASLLALSRLVARW